MSQCYIDTTVFIDYFSDLTNIHLTKQISGESTVEAKHTFERVRESHSITVQHYHSGNGIFETKMFKDIVSTDVQIISFVESTPITKI